MHTQTKHTAMSELNLKSNFPIATSTNWREMVESGLRGATFDSLLRRTEDGLLRGPLMTENDLPENLARLGRIDLPKSETRPWHIAAPVRGQNLDHANAQLLENLKGGASAVRVENGQDIKTRNDLKRLLEGVFTDLVPIHFAPNTNNAASLDMALSIPSLSTATIWAGLNPINDKAKIDSHVNHAPIEWKLMALSAIKTHESGGTDVQELASLAAHLAEAMRTFGPDIVCKHIVIELAADRDTHLTIAKTRAARQITRRIADAFGSDGTCIPICAVTSLRMMQSEDAWTNLLRVMSAGFGAVIGGADVITTRPFTDSLGEATPFAHRIARNMQLMMMEESHLGQVSDPGHGSYWHEHMTDALAQAAWRSFQIIEQKGGITTYLKSGEFNTALRAAKAARQARAEPILGLDLHPADDVKTPEVRT